MLCNCDDPFESNFFKYFVLNFNRLGLKKLIATCYTGSPIANKQLSIFDILGESEETQNKPYKAVVTTVYDKTGDGGVDMLDVAELFKSGENELTELKGDGDFRSPECLELLDEADIVVTNPPFSLFREYVAVLVEHKKKYLIIGNVNAVKYKEIFPLFMKNELWLGASIHSGDRAFFVPDNYPLDASGCGIDEETGRKFIRVKGVRWFTNMDIPKRQERLDLVCHYTKEEYPHYEDYDAIDVSDTFTIPFDYDGYIGVPITFLYYFNPNQFEILSCCEPCIKVETLRRMPKFKEYKSRQKMYNGILCQKKYHRILIRNKHPKAL